MSAYLSYMKAFGNDLRQIAVWEPGTHVELGDYGEVRKQSWERLGNLWDLIPKADQRVREYRNSTLDQLSLGSAEVIRGNSDAGFAGVPGSLSISIRFGKEDSVFVRADKCETRSLTHIQEIAEQVASYNGWEKNWTFVSEVRSAKRFLVLLGSTAGGQVQVTAKTNDLLDSFLAGGITADIGIQISGSEVLQFLGRSGPIHMSLVRVSGPSLLRRRTKVERVEFAEGKAGTQEPVFVENVDAEEFVEALTTSR